MVQLAWAKRQAYQHGDTSLSYQYTASALSPLSPFQDSSELNPHEEQSPSCPVLVLGSPSLLPALTVLVATQGIGPRPSTDAGELAVVPLVVKVRS